MPRASRPGRASSPAPPGYLLFSRPRARHPPNPSAATASCRTPHTHRAPISPSRFKTKSPAAVTLLRPQLRPLLPSGVPNLLRRPLTSHTPNLSLPSRVRSMASPALISDTDQWKALQAHVGAIHLTHPRDLMADADRCKAMTTEFEGVYLDYSRQQATTKTIDKLFELAKAAKLEEKIDKMFSGEKINTTENRSSARSLESAKTLTTPARLLQAMLPPAEP